MIPLLDANLLLACAWESHAQHAHARTWLERQRRFATCPITQLGFLRVSLSPAFRATHADALTALKDIIDRQGAVFLPDDAAPVGLPSVSHHADITDAYLVALARAHACKLATLDESLCAKAWAKDVAVNPLLRSTGSRTA